MRFILSVLLLAPLPLSAQVFASESSSIEFALRAAIGFFGTIALFVFFGGFGSYITRLGTERREEGIRIMEKGLTILIVVIIAIAILYWIEK